MKRTAKQYMILAMENCFDNGDDIGSQFGSCHYTKFADFFDLAQQNAYGWAELEDEDYNEMLKIKAYNHKDRQFASERKLHKQRQLRK